MLRDPSTHTSSGALRQYLACGLIALLLLVQVALSWRDAPNSDARGANISPDFLAFYCAGAASNSGENPYLDAPLQRCGAADGAVPSFARNGVQPSPLPPYDLPLFRLFALLPYRVAATVWLVAALVATAIVVAFLAGRSGLSLLAVTALCGLPLFLLSASLGQLPPIVALALCSAAELLRRKSYWLAGAACTAAFIEPHVAVPVWLSLFAWERRLRGPLLAGVTLLLLLSLAGANLATNVTFYTTVLSLHAASEVSVFFQYSLTWLAFLVGLSSHAALRLGSLSYGIMMIVGVWLAHEAARRFKSQDYLIFVPVAAIVLGGPFVHITQLSLAMLAALVLIPRMGDTLRWPLWLSIACLAAIWWMPTWETRSWTLTRVESVAAFAIAFFLAANGLPQRRRIALGVLAACAYVAVTILILRAPETPLRPLERPAVYAQQLGQNLKYASGRAGVVNLALPERPSATSLRALISKLPSWFGVALLLSVIVGRLRSEPTTRAIAARMGRARIVPTSPLQPAAASEGHTE